MILQEKNYIHNQKKKYLLLSCVWTVIVLVIFITGLLLTGTRANLFTVSACLIAIVASLFITRFISFSRYKDADNERAEVLEHMEGQYHLYHSALIPYEKGVAFFEHIIVTSKRIYFIAYTKEQVEQYREWVQELMSVRGVATKYLQFFTAKDVAQMKNHRSRIENEIIEDQNEEASTALETYSKKINEILM